MMIIDVSIFFHVVSFLPREGFSHLFLRRAWQAGVTTNTRVISYDEVLVFLFSVELDDLNSSTQIDHDLQ